jgi:alpha-beta hydrolase superfamily lysophospholipase
MPVFLLGGTKDIIRDMDKITARLRGLVPDLTVKMMAGAGHSLINTDESVMKFLEAESVGEERVLA